MPIYEYACRKCEKIFEELVVRKSDEAEVRCPACSSARVDRVLSRTAPSRGGGSSGGGACGPVG